MKTKQENPGFPHRKRAKFNADRCLSTSEHLRNHHTHTHAHIHTHTTYMTSSMVFDALLALVAMPMTDAMVVRAPARPITHAHAPAAAAETAGAAAHFSTAVERPARLADAAVPLLGHFHGVLCSGGRLRPLGGYATCLLDHATLLAKLKFTASMRSGIWSILLLWSKLQVPSLKPGSCLAR